MAELSVTCVFLIVVLETPGPSTRPPEFAARSWNFPPKKRGKSLVRRALLPAMTLFRTVTISLPPSGPNPG